MAARAGPLDRGVAVRDEPGDGEGHGQAVVVEAVGGGPAQAGAAVDPEVVAVDLDASRRAPPGRPRSRRSGRIPCGGARRRHGSWSCRRPPRPPGTGPGSRRSRRPRRPGRCRCRGARAERTTRSASGSPTPSSAPPTGRSSMSAPIAAQEVDDRAARRVDADVVQDQLGVGMDRARPPARRRPRRRRPAPARRSPAPPALLAPSSSRARRGRPRARPARRVPGASAPCDRASRSIR